MDIITALILILFTISLVKLLQNYQNKKRINDLLDQLPGDRWYPIIGTTYEILKAGKKGFWEAYKGRNSRGGYIFKSWLGPTPSVHVAKAEYVEALLSNPVNLTKGPNYRFFKPFLREGLFTASGKQWHVHRKLITPTFHFNILDQFQDVFNEKALELVDVLNSKADGSFFDIWHYIANSNLDVISETSMGYKFGALKDPNSKFPKTIYRLAELMYTRMHNPLLHSDFIYGLTKEGREQEKHFTYLRNLIFDLVHKRRETFRTKMANRKEMSEEDKLMGKKERMAFLDLLLENNVNNQILSDDEIYDEVTTFLVAGHETTTVAVAWTLFCLANHPHIQKKVQEELEDIFQGEDRPLTSQDLQKLKYLDRVIRETMRVYTVAPAIARSIEHEMKVGDYVIPPGVMMVVQLYELHRDPEQFPNPEKFDPDRFLPEECAKRHPFSYLPFSAGLRNCVGQKFAMRNMKTMLSALLRKYEVSAFDTMESMEITCAISLKPAKGMYLGLTKRS